MSKGRKKKENSIHPQMIELLWTHPAVSMEDRFPMLPTPSVPTQPAIAPDETGNLT